MFAASGGQLRAVEAVLAQIDEGIDGEIVEGITLLGGEPLQQMLPVTALSQGAQARGLGVLVFTGYSLAEAHMRPGFGDLWAAVDTLVDGRFDSTRPDRDRGVVGSTNQQLHHRTTRYADPRLWNTPDRAEVHVSPTGQVTVHGVPRLSGRLVRTLLRT